ncbi:MAG: UDP-3-O-acyl-N-acetylglucosamine deacetylase [Gemmataceae bacterium]
MRKLTSRSQRTIARPVCVRGVGYITGANVSLQFAPAPPSTGIVFVRTDLPPQVCIPARIDKVTGTSRRTTLGSMPRCVTVVEHVLAALAGLRIDNCYVELNAIEPPGMDGSSRPFVKALREAGIVDQSADRDVWTVDRPLIVERNGATLTLHPAVGEELRISYLLDYGGFNPIMPQRHSQTIYPQSFINEIAPCRTYLLEAEAHELRRQGIGSRTRVTDLVVFGPQGPIENKLRFADEPARHKILDIIGDLALLGCDVRGHIVGYRSGHPLNAELTQELADMIPTTTILQSRAA